MNEESPLSAFDSVNVVSLRAGDVLLFRCQARLNDARRAQVVEVLNEVFPGYESMILDGGQDIAVLRPEPGLFKRLFAWAKGGDRG